MKLAAYSTARQLLASYFCRTFLCAGLIGPGESELASFPNPDEDALANRQQPPPQPQASRWPAWISLSKTWNVTKVTSEISSSRSTISCATPALRHSISAAGVLPAPYAPLATVNDKPAAPKTGTALLHRFRFEACFSDMQISQGSAGIQAAPGYAWETTGAMRARIKISASAASKHQMRVSLGSYNASVLPTSSHARAARGDDGVAERS